MSLRRLGFLPIFFIALTVVLAVAVVLRIRSYDDKPVDARPGTGPEAATAHETMQPVPVMETAEPEPPPSQTAIARGFGIEVLNAQPEIGGTPAPPPATTDVPSPSVAVPVVARPSASAPAATSTRLSPRGSSRPDADARPSQGPSSSSSSGSTSSPSPEPSPSAPSDESPVDENDPTSDTAAPQLASLEFTPPEVRDGQETVLTVQATDALSGIRSVSGTLVAPTGAVQGFACQKIGEGGRFVARIAVPRDAAEGVWQINHLSILDNANNIATFTPRGTLPANANFRVISSQPDDKGPTLKALWIDKRSMRGGDKNTLFVEADDDKSGVNLVTGILNSPTRLARVGFVCRTSGPATYECEVTAPACADCGEWRLEQMQLQDKANNMTTVRSDNPLVGAIRIDVSSAACDATPPQLLTLNLDQNSISNAQAGTITVTATLSDDACGVLSVSGHATGPSPTGAPLHFFLSVSGDPQVWTGKISIPQLLAKGPWRIARMQVLDKGQNLKTYSSADPVLSNAVFEVR